MFLDNEQDNKCLSLAGNKLGSDASVLFGPHWSSDVDLIRHNLIEWILSRHKPIAHYFKRCVLPNEVCSLSQLDCFFSNFHGVNLTALSGLTDLWKGFPHNLGVRLAANQALYSDLLPFKTWLTLTASNWKISFMWLSASPSWWRPLWLQHLPGRGRWGLKLPAATVKWE